MITREIRTDGLLFLPLYCGLYIVGLVIVSRYRITRDDHEGTPRCARRAQGELELAGGIAVEFRD